MRLFRAGRRPFTRHFFDPPVRHLAWSQANLAEACQKLEESLDLFQQVRNEWGIAYALMYLGGIEFDRANFAGAETKLTESLALFQQEGYRPGIAEALNLRGLAVFEQGDWREGIRQNLESLDLHIKGGNRPGMLDALESLALLSEASNLPEQSARLLAVTELSRQLNGIPGGPPFKKLTAGLREKLVNRLGEKFSEVQAEAENKPLEEIIGSLDFEATLTGLEAKTAQPDPTVFSSGNPAG